MRNFIISTAILLMCVSGSAWGQRIGYLDTKKVMDRYGGTAEVRQEVNRAVEAWNREIASRKQAIDSLERELDDQQLVISSERRKLKREEIKRRRQALEEFVREVYDQGGKAEQKNRELARPMVEKIGAIVKKVALDNNLQLVLDSSTGGLVYAAKDLDITDLVIEELDKAEGRTTKAMASVVVFPLSDADQESRRKQYAKQVHDLLWSAVDRGNTAKPLAKREVDDLLKDKGLANKPVPEARAYELARILNAEFMILGQVTADAQTGRIAITAKLYNVDLKQLMVEATEEARDEKEMSQAVDKIAERLGQKVTGQ